MVCDSATQILYSPPFMETEYQAEIPDYEALFREEIFQDISSTSNKQNIISVPVESFRNSVAVSSLSIQDIIYTNGYFQRKDCAIDSPSYDGTIFSNWVSIEIIQTLDYISKSTYLAVNFPFHRKPFLATISSVSC